MNAHIETGGAMDLQTDKDQLAKTYDFAIQSFRSL